MQQIKDFIARQLLYNKYHFKCNCLIPIDITGMVVDYEIVNNEIIWLVDFNGKIIKIGENHPNMMIE